VPYRSFRSLSFARPGAIPGSSFLLTGSPLTSRRHELQECRIENMVVLEILTEKEAAEALTKACVVRLVLEIKGADMLEICYKFSG